METHSAMANLAKILRDETARIARKEVRAETGSTRKASTQYRRDIAELKRKLAAVEKEVRFLRKQEDKRAASKPSLTLAASARFSPRWVKANREKLGLSAADYGELVGVHAMTIYNWEHGRSKPQKEQLASLVAVRKLSRREAMRRLDLD